MKKIAVLTSGWTVDYVISLVKGMECVCKANNVNLYVFTSYKFIEPSGDANITSFSVFELINFKEYDGVVIIPGLFTDDKMVEKYVNKILKANIPAVSIGVRVPGLKYIENENYEAIKNLFLHLIKDHNVKTFGFINGPEEDPETQRSSYFFNQLVTEAGLDVEKAVLYQGYTDWTYSSAYAQALKMFSNGNRIPETVIVINHHCAMAIIRAAVEKGYSVPEQIKVVALDDSTLSTKVIPSITAINNDPESIGKVAIEALLSKDFDKSEWRIQSYYLKRQSCGCKRSVSQEQIINSQSFVKQLDIEQRFASQLRFIEDSFLRSITVPELCDDLQKFFAKRHFFEGPDFAICIDKTVINNMTETLTENICRTSYAKTVQTIANIQNGEPAKLVEFETADIIPPNMRSEKSSVYLIFPVFVQNNVYGYYVSKDYLGLLLNKAAYNWVKNIGSCIEKYRQTSVYRRMSEQLQILSTQDALSGLYNRTGLYNVGVELFMKNYHDQKSTEIIFVDINDMKYINDRFGHLQGDLAIKTVAEVISNSVPKNYVCVRYGGDEFVIIGTPVTDEDYGAVITQQLQEKNIQMSLPYKLTASIGSKVFAPGEKDILSEAISEVDKIMYQKKSEYHKYNG